jgi:NAD(P)-dependent dehydrogenase (short-subunit alcohol dehydrogenase family)
MVESVDEWGGLDVIFNNAGIMHAQVSPLPLSARSLTLPLTEAIG